MKALFHTLGCKLNFAESSTIESALTERGFTIVDRDESPDIIVVNTCTVTSEADKKSRQTIRALNRRHPEAAIFVTGCYSQLSSDEASKLPGVVAVVGNDRKDRLAEHLDRWLSDHNPRVDVTPHITDFLPFVPSCAQGERTRWFLKVQDGCDYWCSYCTIPRARGRSRSPRIADVVAEARRAAGKGAREIVITGVNIGDFGHGTDEDFFALCKALDTVPGIERYRISSIEPNLLSDSLIEWIATESRAFMPHFHIPLQCGSDEVLRLMGRHYDTALFAHRISTIRRLIPDAFIGVDLIVGFRGETDVLFDESHDFISSLDISRLHVFPYSERPDTRALKIPHVVDQAEKSRRAARMLALSNDKLADFSRRFLGEVRPVLFEINGAGFTDNYLRVSRLTNVTTMPESNTIAQVRLADFDPASLTFTAELV